MTETFRMISLKASVIKIELLRFLVFMHKLRMNIKEVKSPFTIQTMINFFFEFNSNEKKVYYYPLFDINDVMVYGVKF